MGHRPRPSGAPNGWLHNAMPCSCLLIPAFLTACHLTTIWAEDIILRHRLASERERKSLASSPAMGRLVRRRHRRSFCAWPVATPRTGEGSGDRGTALARPARSLLAQDQRTACWPGAQKPNMRGQAPTAIEAISTHNGGYLRAGCIDAGHILPCRRWYPWVACVTGGWGLITRVADCRKEHAVAARGSYPSKNYCGKIAP
jgi:hypothetical protein